MKRTHLTSLRQSYLPFIIGEAERSPWMGYMMRAMDDVGVDKNSVMS